MYRLSAEAEKTAERAGSARASARSFPNAPIFETLLLSPPALPLQARTGSGETP